MDIKKEIESIVNRIKNDKGLMKKFEADPVAAVESVIGHDLPDDTVKQIVTAVKANLSVDSVKGAIGKLGGLFGK